MEYSVVIPARDAARTLPRVLDALALQEPQPLEVIVVDDGSSDGTARVAEERGARVVARGGRSFAGGARNAGWEQAHGDLVVFLDADVVPDSGWGEGVARAAREFPGALVGCARTFHADTPWAGSRTCRSRRRTCRAARRGKRRSCRRSACSRRASCRFAGTRATGPRTRSSAPPPARPACALSSTRALPRLTSTSAAPSPTCAPAAAPRLRPGAGELARAGPRAQARTAAAAALLPPAPPARRLPEGRSRRGAAETLPGPPARLAVAEWTLGASALRQAARRPALRGGPQPLFE